MSRCESKTDCVLFFFQKSITAERKQVECRQLSSSSSESFIDFLVVIATIFYWVITQYFPHQWEVTGDLDRCEIVDRLTVIKETWFQIFHFYFQNDKTLDQTKFKAFADDTLTFAEKLISFYDSTENIVGRGESAGYQHFLLSQQFFKNDSIPDPWKPRIVWERVKVTIFPN